GLASAHVEAYLPPLAAGGALRADFALRVHGVSMADLIQPDDIVLRAAPRPTRSGDICAMRAGQATATLQSLDPLPPGPYRPPPPIPDGLTLEVDGREPTIDGVYRRLLRGSAAEGLLLTNSSGPRGLFRSRGAPAARRLRPRPPAPAAPRP